MSATLTVAPEVPTRRAKEIVYPDSDGQPMADNTKQFRNIFVIQGGLDALYAERTDVFVAGDLLWYPVQGQPTTRMAPDVMVVFGRPKGDRGSYMQWAEEGIAPQVAFEVLSPSNRLPEMLRKFSFYDRYGIEEYYIYDPDDIEFHVALRQNGELTVVDFTGEWTSPLLGVRFELPEDADDLAIYRPDGVRFKTFVELSAERDALAIERTSLIAERDLLTTERDAERERNVRLAARLRELGIDPAEL